MTQKKDTKIADASGGGDTRTLGRPADQSIKESRPQVADKDKLGSAISKISDLDARLARLNDASGPFGSGDVDFKSGRVDALLDEPKVEAPVETADEVEVIAAPAPEVVEDRVDIEDDADVPLDELLGNDFMSEEIVEEETSDDAAPDDLAILDDIAEMGTTPEAEKIVATPILNGEVAAMEDDDYNASLSAFLDEIPEDDQYSSYQDPIDEMVDDALSLDAADVDGEKVEASTEEEANDDGNSPFAVLFGSVDDTQEELTDSGIEEDTSFDDVEPDVTEVAEEPIDIESDEDLFFDDFPPIAGSDDSEGNLISLPGADTFDDIDADIDEKASDEGDDPHAGLPQLTMGGDEGMFAPGTGYADEDYTHNSIEEETLIEPDFGDLDENENDDDIEKDDEMAISVGGSEGEKPEDEINTFDTEGLDDLVEGDLTGDDVSPEFNEHDFEEEAVTDTAAVDEIFGADDEDDQPSDPVVDALGETSIEETPEAAEVEAAEDMAAEDAPAEPAKKGKMKALLMTAASVAVLGGGLGFAAMNGMIPGVDLGNSSQPTVVAQNDGATPPSPTYSVNDFGIDDGTGPSEDLLASFDDAIEEEPGTIRLSDLMASNDEQDDLLAGLNDLEGDLEDGIDGLKDDLAGILDPVEDTVDGLAEEVSTADLSDGLTDAVDGLKDDVDGVVDDMKDGMGDAFADLTDDLNGAADGLGDLVEDTVDMELPIPVTTTGLGEDTSTADMSDEADVFDPISELAAQIQGGNASDDEVAENAVDGGEASGSLFVEESRVIAVEDDVTAISLQMESLTSEVSQLNDLILQSMERSSVIGDRVESNERSLRGVSTILSELAKTGDSLDQTQIVLLDIAARVGSLEASNPADRNEVSEALRQIDDEMKRLTANMAILARMTVNGVGALQAEGASAGTSAVQTTQAELPSVGSNTIFAEDAAAAATGTTQQPSSISPDVAEGDFVDGYGYVLDIVPASGNQKLVIMENGSALVPK
jgi:hypothetical protein